MMNTDKTPQKKLSCKRCQHRKLRCSRTFPCANCSTANANCEYKLIDKKRAPASSDYAASLERRVQSLEHFIGELRNAPAQDRDAMLQAFCETEPLTSPSIPEQETPFGPYDIARGYLCPGNQGNVIFQGPTSILRGNSSFERADVTRNARLADLALPQAASDFEHVAGHFGIDLNSTAIMGGLQKFFKWQYPQFMFIYREAFLRDHFGSRKECKYWSPALLMSVCALGLLMSEDDNERDMGARCFLAAESITIVAGSAGSSLVLVQSFLCLAFYEIGRGNLSKGWSLSGIAFRMSQDLGLHRDPMHWNMDNTTLPHSEDIEIRRRIYWGCYNSDKLISLILSRPVQLTYNAAHVELLNIIPDGPHMESWRPAGFDMNQFGSTGVHSNIPYLRQQIRLSRMIERMLETVLSPQLSSNLQTLDKHLDQLNLELCRWIEQLPDFAKFGPRAKLGPYPVPGVTGLHLLFHSIRIALNLDRATTDDQSSILAVCRQHCGSSAKEITDLIRIYRLNFGLQHSSLVLVYAATQALRAVRAFGIAEQYESLVEVLTQSSQSWSLVNQVLDQTTES